MIDYYCLYSYMKRGSTLFLKIVLVLIAAIALTGMIWFPLIEGRNVNGNFVSIYLQDPVLAYAYAASSPFFIGLYQAFKILGYIEKNKVFSQASVVALRNIKYCAIAFVGFIVVAMPWIMMIAEADDAPGVVAIGVVAIFASVVIATATAVFQRLLQNAIEFKSENDLTV